MEKLQRIFTHDINYIKKIKLKKTTCRWGYLLKNKKRFLKFNLRIEQGTFKRKTES